MLLAPGDDAAIYRQAVETDLILTCDWFLEGVHFLRRLHPAESVGWKSLARAVSDIAAMGGQPSCYLLSLAIPPECTTRWLDGFLRGLRNASRRFDCALAGGDTTKRDEILVHLTVLGKTGKNLAIRRSRARPGDLIFVTGRLGEAEIGLRLLRRQAKPRLTRNGPLRKHLYPEPRIAIGQWLAKHRLASALMDLSDGLSTDLPRLCRASGVGARISARKLPLPAMYSGAKGHGLNPMLLALHGGDDYELLFTVPQHKAHLVPKHFQDVPLTAIGEVTRTKKLILTLPGGGSVPLRSQGWDPFRTQVTGSWHGANV